MDEVDPREAHELYKDPDKLRPKGPPRRRSSGLSEMLPVRLSPQILGALRLRARSEERSVSWVVRQAIEQHLVSSWEEGEPIDVKRTHPPTSVVSIRVPNELLRSLSERARAEGKSTSHLARELLEDALRGDRPSTPAELARMFSRWAEEAL